jgi:uncharacterized CHY-type Zn-finger protein
MNILKIIEGQTNLIMDSITNDFAKSTIICFHCGKEVDEKELIDELHCPYCHNEAYKLNDDGNIIPWGFEDDNPYQD